MEAQPLLVPGLTLKDGRTRDAAFVCTMSNNVWAFDANDGTVLWKTPAPLGRPIRGTKDIDMWLVNDRWGILGTPVIDPDAGTLYVVSWSLLPGAAADNVVPKNPTGNTVHRLHALDVADGSERRPPLTIDAAVPGTAARFLSHRQKQRAALLLAPPAGPHGRKTLFMACGQFGETQADRHGWVVAFDVGSFRQTAAFCVTPNGSGGGVWQAGQGPAADADGFVYFMTGNGLRRGRTDFGESVVKLRYTPPAGAGPGQLEVADWFTPFRDKDRGDGSPSNVRGVDYRDQDLGLRRAARAGEAGAGGRRRQGRRPLRHGQGAAGERLPKLRRPEQPARPDEAEEPAPVLHVLSRVRRGRRGRGDAGRLRDRPAEGEPPGQDAPPAPLAGVLGGGRPRADAVLLGGEREPAGVGGRGRRAVTFLAKGNELASPELGNPGGMPGGLLTLSADGGRHGVVWATVPRRDANQERTRGTLFAYDAAEFQPGPAGP